MNEDREIEPPAKPEFEFYHRVSFISGRYLYICIRAELNERGLGAANFSGGKSQNKKAMSF